MRVKAITCLLIAVLLLPLGCSTVNDSTASVPEPTKNLAPTPTIEPTPTPTQEPTPTPSPTPEPTPTPTPTPTPSSWVVDYYVDDFGDKTSDSYLRGSFKGKFSNSATTGSNLTVYFYYDTTICSIRLLEYDSHKATFYTSDDVTLKFKVDNKEYTIELIILSSGDDLYFTSSESNYYTLKKALTDGKEIKCVIRSRKYSDTYQFTMDGIGFSEAMEKAGMH